MPSAFAFPPGFIWGSATASYQIEGAATEDGRGPSIWDTFCQQPGRVKNGDSGAVACDHYHRYRDDIKLMKELGLQAYRLSVAWPRVVPDGDGAVNQKGLDFYSRLVDALLEAGITPFVTCYHWDMPEATYRKHGGWHGRQTAYDMARFAGITAKALGDRVKHWFTVNETSCYTLLGYSSGVHAPGEKVDRKRLNQLIHHALLGHGLCVDAIRASAPKPVQTGLASNPDISVPVIETPEHIAAAEQATNAENGCFLVPVIKGAYDPQWWASQGGDVPQIQNGDMEQISRPLDMVGLNLYSGRYKRSNGQGGYDVVPLTEHYPVYNIRWLHHLPDVLYWGLRWSHQTLGIKNLYISENGCCASDVPNEKGEILDVDRVQYLRSYLRSAHRALSEGIPLKGYFLWSLMDNFEWAEGCSKRFGICYTDFSTLERRLKLSARWYAQVARQNRVL